VLNRGAGRRRLFRNLADAAAFLRMLDEALERRPTRSLGYCLMPTPWHVVVRPEADAQLTRLQRWLTLTQAVRWHARYRSTGSGHVYQNRFTKAPAMFKGAPAGAFNKTGRTDPVNDPDVLRADLDPYHQGPNHFALFVPVGLV
jgi:hypothetical protein